MNLSTQLDLETFRQYSGLSLRRHVAYPMPTYWEGDLSFDRADAMFRESEKAEHEHDLSLYLHVPFCEALCKFCACNRIVQRHTAPGAAERTERYVRALKWEITKRGGERNAHRELQQIHWGGGSPSYLEPNVIADIFETIRNSFRNWDYPIRRQIFAGFRCVTDVE